ncbi:MAG: cation diffusion facilitator family transporter [Hyphomicrobiaceae bacterium]
MDRHEHSDHGHDHSAHAHGHGHGSHTHTPRDYGPAFAIGAALNIGFVIVEAIYGLLANSMALLADAGHNLSDVLGLLLAWAAVWLGRRRATTRFTYGLRSASIQAAVINAILLLVAIGAIAWEAIGRLMVSAPVASATVMAVAAIGFAVNAATAWLFFEGRHGDLNVRGAYLHMAADAGVSLGVVAAGALIALTDWRWIDPVVSLVIAAIIVAGTWPLLRDSVSLALQAVPAQIDTASVQAYLRQLPGVASVHHLHVWAMSTTEVALTCHLVVRPEHPGDALLRAAAEGLSHRFGIGHATLQIESVSDGGCGNVEGC